MTPFTRILRHTVENVPGALGAIFADWEGEAIGSFAPKIGHDELLIIGAHFGVILNHVQSALHLTHFGEADEIIFQHQKIDLIIRSIDRDYYVVLAIEAGAHLATALRETLAAAKALRAEM